MVLDVCRRDAAQARQQLRDYVQRPCPCGAYCNRLSAAPAEVTSSGRWQDHVGVSGLVESLPFPVEMEAPVLIEVVVGPRGPLLERSFGATDAPASTGDAKAIRSATKYRPVPSRAPW